MPIANTTSPKGTRPRAKVASKPASAKTSTARRPRSSARGATQAKATRAKAAQTATRETTGVFGDYAERAVLIPVGAALIARDRVVTTVSDTLSTYSSTSKAQAQLRRFERRGATARSRLEREVRKARVRVERELRQRRRVIESTVSDIEGRRDAFAKNGGELANRVPELANRVQERILSLV
jgi:hypothetical protein